MRVITAKYLKNFILQITFDNKKSKEIDFEYFLTESKNPEIRKYLDERKFKKFLLINGDLVWGDNEDLAFSEESLIKSPPVFPLPKMSKLFLKEVKKYLELNEDKFTTIAAEPLEHYKRK